jgi:hypothetical protein
MMAKLYDTIFGCWHGHYSFPITVRPGAGKRCAAAARTGTYVVCDTTKKTIEIYRDSQLYELPDDLRNRLRTAIVAKCEARKKAGPTKV